VRKREETENDKERAGESGDDIQRERAVSVVA